MKRARALPALLLVLAFSFTTATVVTTGCGSTTAIKTEYQTLGAVAEARDLAMKAWATYYVSRTCGSDNCPPSADLKAKDDKVAAADAKFLSALKVFRGVVTVAYSDKTAAPPDLAAAASALVDLINGFLGKKVTP